MRLEITYQHFAVKTLYLFSLLSYFPEDIPTTILSFVSGIWLCSHIYSPVFLLKIILGFKSQIALLADDTSRTISGSREFECRSWRDCCVRGSTLCGRSGESYQIPKRPRFQKKWATEAERSRAWTMTNVDEIHARLLLRCINVFAFPPTLV
jgi:hypothetical protein